MSDTSINTDKELYREPTKTDEEGGNNAGMEPHVFVTEDGGIGMNYYGKVIVKPIKEWVNSSWKEVGYKPPEEQMNTITTLPEQKPQHSIYTHCWKCHMWGINLPNNTQCGNCGSLETTTYYPEEELSLALSEERQRIREIIRAGKKEMNTLLEGDDGRDIRTYNQALNDVLEALEEQKEEA